jgi:hypothetical protein
MGILGWFFYLWFFSHDLSLEGKMRAVNRYTLRVMFSVYTNDLLGTTWQAKKITTSSNIIHIVGSKAGIREHRHI